MKVTALSLVALATAVFAGTLDSSLDKRACTPTTCHCNGIQGQFCGYDDPANPGCKTGYVYECQAGTGNACSYGPRNSCQQCGELQC
ncbi:uncharacterized protein BKA55DRAFT_694784 [Fusarium redolens]|uniref:Uncharacterized protein n=1 Tax=Fusarium redolens TaxID=48865 RepID=A0A9P9JRT7_FUSRE|nr:uncharacterized protein BKA55DRAFT_694784 [Fusarium redolens]KAH7234613.1 hypothetical protein BKA55DRAFT_694784 [Fusarium redolens]